MEQPFAKPGARRNRRTAALVAAGAATALAAAVVVPAVASAGQDGSAKGGQDAKGAKKSAAVEEDFNGDGYQDMAVTAPGGSSGAGSAGYVTVFYGTPDGLDRDNAVTISQATDGVPGEPTDGNRFGWRIAGADLDRDGYTDLAVRVPGDKQVVVLWGGADGVTGKGSAVIEGDNPGNTFDAGELLTAGDFNGDGNPDLLMGRGHEHGTYGLLQGPFTRDGQWAEEQQIPLTTSYNDVLSVTAGDIDGDGADDLVVHQGFEEMARENLFFTGGEDGLTRTDTKVPMGATGAIGDFDGDGYGDLAYREMPGGVVENLPYDEGTVKVIHGTADGLGDRVKTYTQDTAGVPGASEENDQFGGALSAGDVTGDGIDDLAVAVPFEAIGDRYAAGSVVLLKGSEGEGLTGAGAQAFHQDTPGISGVAEANDRFGAAVRLLDVNGDGKADLTVGSPGEAIGDAADAGAIWYLPGTADGLTATGSFDVNPGTVGAELPGAQFGRDLTNSSYGPLMARN
ncbi:VCBS repeat-containing protein [Streptomyces sp. XM4193]|uniref:FG-GAP and VCBS repeat-containing protein n=1 Tax=Streptomyces sp. XM4193 TaxID=2929782 RepID=UPI001FFA8E75|nr:FG-GAP and VCBS repeat-containing protein [Streptomyces sp. XM4193]MCK1795723.1 VCBS repeat-containing protein [Streptomyces sp. XM4193]